MTNDEIEVLQSSATDIVKNIPSGAMFIELGSGLVTSQVRHPAPGDSGADHVCAHLATSGR